MIKKIKTWLRQEIKDHQEIVDADDNNEDHITSDGTDDIFIGRHECAEGLLNQIKKWEKNG